tara:strand:+ start:1757 stop:2809 length:1053 start_codon:yes stop_codon:yes gene_type:complete
MQITQQHTYPQSIIIAGGKGSRFGKLSAKKPKHTLPVVGTPLIDYHVDLLGEQRPTRFAYSEHNREFLDDYFKKFAGLISSGLLIPHLDTAMKGPIYPLVELLTDRPSTGNVVGIAGDMFGHVDVDDVLEFHNRKGRPMTLVAVRTYPTMSACVFDVDEDDGLRAIHRNVGISLEDDLINLGVYVADSDLLTKLATDLDSYKEDSVFTTLAEQDSLSVYVLDGRAVNINTPYNLLCANLGELERLCDYTGELPDHVKFDSDSASLLLQGSNIDPSTKLKRTVIGRNASGAKNGSIENSVVMDDVELGERVDIEYCILQNNASIPPESTIRSSIVYSDGTIEPMVIPHKPW